MYRTRNQTFLLTFAVGLAGFLSTTSYAAEQTLVQMLAEQLRSEQLPKHALEFDGETSHVTIPSWHYDGSHDITIEAVVSADRVTGVIAADTQRAGVGLGFSNGRLNVHAWNGTDYVQALADAPAVAGLRMHVAGVFDRKRLFLFVNGKRQRDTPAVKDGAFRASRMKMTIGASPSPQDPGIDFPFTGIIEAVRISKIARYAEDFAPTFDFESDDDTTLLLRFDDGAGELVQDSSANNHDGKLTGPTWVGRNEIRSRAARALARRQTAPAAAVLQLAEKEGSEPVRKIATAALNQINPTSRSTQRESAARQEVEGNVDRLVELIRRRALTRRTSARDHGLFLCEVSTGDVTMAADESRDGSSHFASACWSNDGQRVVFDATPGREYSKSRIRTIDFANKNAKPADLGPGNCPSFSPDGRRIAFLLNRGAVPGASSGVWTMNTDGSNRKRLGGYGRPFWCPDGRRLLIANFSRPRTFSLQDVETAERREIVLPGHQFTSDARWAGDAHTLVAVVEADGKKRIVLLDISDWETTTIKQVLWEAGQQLTPVAASYRAQTRQCVFIGRDRNGAAVYSLVAGGGKAPKRLERSGYDAQMSGARFSPDGRYVLFASDRVHPRIELAGPIAATATWPVAGENEARFAVFSSDKRELFTGGVPQLIKVWDTHTGKQRRTISGHGRSSTCAAISRDGELLATGSYSTTVFLWDAKSGQRVADLNTGEPAALALDFSPDGKHLAVGSRTGKVVILNLESMEKMCETPSQSLPITHVAFSPDGKTLATTSSDWRKPNERGEVKLWSADDLKELATFDSHVSTISSVAFSPDGKLLATGGGRARLIIWDIETRKIRADITTPNGVQDLAFLPDGKRIAAAVYLGGVWLWDVASGQPVVQYEGHSDTKSLFDLAMTKDGSLIATVGSQGDVKLWSTKVD